jgi:hypothetical protein
MSAVTLWLVVDHAQTVQYNGGDIWTRVMMTDFAPTGGDEITLWGPNDNGAASGPNWCVVGRYWASDGGVHITLADMHVDPDERMQRVIFENSDIRPWYTDTDGGDPEPLLEAGGWTRYRDADD